jgi:hypothetical protein
MDDHKTGVKAKAMASLVTMMKMPNKTANAVMILSEEVLSPYPDGWSTIVLAMGAETSEAVTIGRFRSRVLMAIVGKA